jgi:hypothetical protein
MTGQNQTNVGRVVRLTADDYEGMERTADAKRTVDARPFVLREVELARKKMAARDAVEATAKVVGATLADR